MLSVHSVVHFARLFISRSGEFIRRAKTMPREARETSGRRLKSPFPVEEESVIFNENAAQSGCGIEKDASGPRCRMPVPAIRRMTSRFDPLLHVLAFMFFMSSMVYSFQKSNGGGAA